MTKKSDAPAIRFKGFSDAWEQRKLASLCEKFTDGDWIESKDQSDFGVRLVQTGNVGVAEYLDKPNNKKWISEDTFDRLHCEEVLPGDILISRLPEPAGRACIVPLLGTKMITAVDCTIVRTAPDMSNKFLVQYLSSQAYFDDVNTCLAGGTRQRISRGNLANFNVPIPVKKSEQDAIGMFFGYLDNLITLHQRKCIFFTGRAGRLISTVNKKRITSSWEQRKFDEVFDCTVPNNTLSRAELSYDEGTVLNVHYGDVLIKYGSVLDVQKDDIPRIPHRCREDFNGALLQDGDVIIADTAEDETTGKACEIGNLQGSAIVSGLHTMVCRPRNRMALGYLGYYLNSNAYHHQLLPLMQGIKVLSLSRSNIQKTSVSYPIAVKEQQLIAYYFSQLDNLITLHQRKYDKLTNVKKSMLEKMFPKNGSNVPEIRFKGFTEAWEQRKVQDVADRFDNLRIPVAANLRVHGTTPYYGANGIQDYVEGFTHDGEFVLVAEDGANDLKNYPVKCVNGRIWVNNHAHVLQGKAGIADNSFLAFAISQSDIESLLVGGGRAKLNAETLMSIEFRLPCLQEQYRIGEYLTQLDHLITLHQRELEKLKNIKKSCLENMFV